MNRLQKIGLIAFSVLLLVSLTLYLSVLGAVNFIQS